eukprot:311119-Prorocentrum_minimum.AAC.1
MIDISYGYRLHVQSVPDFGGVRLRDLQTSSRPPPDPLQSCFRPPSDPLQTPFRPLCLSEVMIGRQSHLRVPGGIPGAGGGGVASLAEHLRPLLTRLAPAAAKRTNVSRSIVTLANHRGGSRILQWSSGLTRA